MIGTVLRVNLNWLVLSDEQMSKRWPFSLLNDEQMSNWVGVKHLPVKGILYKLFETHLAHWDHEIPVQKGFLAAAICRAFFPATKSHDEGIPMILFAVYRSISLYNLYRCWLRDDRKYVGI